MLIWLLGNMSKSNILYNDSPLATSGSQLSAEKSGQSERLLRFIDREKPCIVKAGV